MLSGLHSQLLCERSKKAIVIPASREINWRPHDLLKVSYVIIGRAGNKRQVLTPRSLLSFQSMLSHFGKADKP